MAAFEIQRYAFSNATADDFEIVSALSGKKIAVVGYHLGAAGTNTVKFTDTIVDEVQTITVSDGDTTDTFTLTYSGQTTTDLDWDADAATVTTALEALSNIGVGDVDVSYASAADGGVYTLTFAGALADTNVTELTSTPTGCTVVHDTTTVGGTTTNLTGAIPTIAGSQLVAVGSPTNPLFKTSEGAALSVTLSAANSVAGYINYVILDER